MTDSGYLSPEFSARFDASYMPEPNSGCWIWIGAVANSYGMIAFDGGSVRAHRASYQKHKGPLGPSDVVMHLCDNKACVNPDHLIAGTARENMRDYHAKLRTDKASYLLRSGAKTRRKTAARKLTDAQVAAIRQSPASHRKIAAVVGITHTVVGLIKRGLVYGDVKSEAVADPELSERLSGLPASGPSEWRGDRRAKARQMRAEGASYTEIALALGTVRSVAFYLVKTAPSEGYAIPLPTL